MPIIKTHNITLAKETDLFHIVLIPMTDDHLPLLYQWNQMPDVLYWCEGLDVVTNTPEEVNGIYGDVSQKAFMFIITVNDQPIGDCWLQEMNYPVLMEKHSSKT